LERHFKPIVEPLKQIVENTVDEESQPIKKEANTAKDIIIKKKREDNNNDNENDDKFWMNDGWLKLMLTTKKATYKTIELHVEFTHVKFCTDRTIELITIYAKERNL